MVRLVVNHQDVLFAAQVFEHTAVKSGIAFRAALHHAVAARVIFSLEHVPVGDLESSLLEAFQHTSRKQVELLVVVVLVPGQKHLQAFPNGQVGTNQKNRIGETAILRVGKFVEHLPGNNHAHDHRFAAASRHFDSVTNEGLVAFCQTFGVIGRVRRDNDALFLSRRRFNQPDERLGGFALAEKEFALPLRIAPMQ